MGSSVFHVGVDFGTSRSGYAYSVMNEDGIKLRTSWPCEEGATFPKNLTCLLYSRLSDGLQVEAWGWEAFKKYTSMGKNDKPDYIYIDRNIKLSLADNPTPLPQGLTPVRVISDYLTYLLKDVDTTLTANYGAQYSRDKVQWCMTVPAGWSQDAKMKMQEAAILAGMVSAEDTARLSMIHEPEAACLGILNAPGADKVLDGQIIMVIDAGGGTVDITMHKAVKQGDAIDIKEVTHRDMVLEGATFVDQRFEEYVLEHLGSKYKTWKTASPKDHVTFLHRMFEHKKRQHVMASSSNYEIEFPHSLYSILSSQSPEVLSKLEDQQHGEGDRLIIEPAQMDALFDKSITLITEASMRAIQRAGQKPDHLFIVGGFADSKYLVGKIREALSGHVGAITCPQCSGSAIMQGAVAHGQRPAAILTRRSPKAYGIRIRDKWVENKSPEGTMIVTDHGNFTSAGFQRFIECDQELPLDHEVTKIRVPSSNVQDRSVLEIYETESSTEQYVTEQGMKMLGKFTVSGYQAAGLGTTRSRESYKVKVCMQFGATIIQVTATDQQSGQKFDTQIAFCA